MNKKILLMAAVSGIVLLIAQHGYAQTIVALPPSSTVTAPPAVEIETDHAVSEHETAEIETPEHDSPEIETPEIETPEIETPEIETPEIPEVHGGKDD